jgi:hypothetical protein
MAELAQTKDEDVQWVVRQNLKKNRLLKNFPEEVESTGRMLGNGSQ